MINLSELVREESSSGIFDSLKFAYNPNVYLFEDAGDFLVNRNRIYVPPIKQFPFQILDAYSKSFYAIMHNVCLEGVKVNDKFIDGYWAVHDESGQFVSLWHDGEEGESMRSAYTFEKANFEQNFESGDFLYSLTLKYFQKASLPVIIDLQKNKNWKCLEEDSILDKIRDKFEEIIIHKPEFN
jgi:hypothetical protein